MLKTHCHELPFISPISRLPIIQQNGMAPSAGLH